MIYKNLIKPCLFSLDPETAHELGAKVLQFMGKSRFACSLSRKLLLSNKQPVEIFGLKFPNFIGQAAGLDKDGLFPRASEALGFGFVEVGTVTPNAQPGNDKPRLFRFPKETALINRMGFNNNGVENLRDRISDAFPKSSRVIPLGINLGKGKSTPLENALDDYCNGFDAVANLADYITINISSPNTPNLRNLHQHEFLEPFLKGIETHRKKWSERNKAVSPPCLLKISPDENFRSLEIIIGKALESNFDGIIACNTSIDPNTLKYKPQELPRGGISGKPIETKSNQVINFIVKMTNSKLPIIGSGGVYDYDSAQRKLDAGASLLQIYTSFVYNGPLWPSRLAKRMSSRKTW